MVTEISIIMNSVAIIALATITKKHTKRLKEFNEMQLEKEQRIEQKMDWEQSTKRMLMEKVKAVENDLKSLRLEMIGKGKRQQVPETYFEDSSEYIKFSDGNSIKESELKYIAEIAIKAIASELPEINITDNTLDNIIKMAPYLDEGSQRTVFGMMLEAVMSMEDDNKKAG